MAVSRSLMGQQEKPRLRSQRFLKHRSPQLRDLRSTHPWLCMVATSIDEHPEFRSVGSGRQRHVASLSPVWLRNAPVPGAVEIA